MASSSRARFPRGRARRRCRDARSRRPARPGRWVYPWRPAARGRRSPSDRPRSAPAVEVREGARSLPGRPARCPAPSARPATIRLRDRRIEPERKRLPRGPKPSRPRAAERSGAASWRLRRTWPRRRRARSALRALRSSERRSPRSASVLRRRARQGSGARGRGRGSHGRRRGRREREPTLPTLNTFPSGGGSSLPALPAQRCAFSRRCCRALRVASGCRAPVRRRARETTSRRRLGPGGQSCMNRRSAGACGQDDVSPSRCRASRPRSPCSVASRSSSALPAASPQRERAYAAPTRASA